MYVIVDLKNLFLFILLLFCSGLAVMLFKIRYFKITPWDSIYGGGKVFGQSKKSVPTQYVI